MADYLLGFNYGRENIVIKTKEGSKFYTVEGVPVNGIEYVYADKHSLKKTTNSKFALHRGDRIPIIDLKYDTIVSLKKLKNFLAKRNNSYYLIDSTGTEILKYDFNSFYETENAFVIERNDKKGLLSSNNGELLIEPQFNSIEVYSKLNRFFLASDGNGTKFIIDKHNNNNNNNKLDSDFNQILETEIIRFDDGYYYAVLSTNGRTFFS